MEFTWRWTALTQPGIACCSVSLTKWYSVKANGPWSIVLSEIVERIQRFLTLIVLTFTTFALGLTKKNRNPRFLFKKKTLHLLFQPDIWKGCKTRNSSWSKWLMTFSWVRFLFSLFFWKIKLNMRQTEMSNDLNMLHLRKEERSAVERNNVLHDHRVYKYEP